MSKANETLEIDGSVGEGGGQILRTSVTLAACTGRSLRLTKIRAGRAKPGLLRQHLTALHAAAEVCAGRLEGVELKSQEASFFPDEPRHGKYSFSIGTAGSTTLVLQTILPILLNRAGESELYLEGGTHNPLAPPYDFLDAIYFPILRKMGVVVEARLLSPGFYPAGGGRISLRLGVPERPRPLSLDEPLASPSLEATIHSSRIAPEVIEREANVLVRELGLAPERVHKLSHRSDGPGNVVALCIGDYELVSSVGERGKPAETVASEVVSAARRYLSSEAPVGEHLADQLVTLLSLFGGSFVTGPLSSHTNTNIETVRKALGPKAVSLEPSQTRNRLLFPGVGL